MRIVIIGASISGMMAAARWPEAQVLEQAGPDALAPVLVATFYAHQPVPRFAHRPITVHTYVDGPGTSMDYAAKVYGDPMAPVSLSHVQRTQTAWCWDNQELLKAIEGRTHFHTRVERISPIDRVVHTVDGQCTGQQYPYDVLLTTAPLPANLRMIGFPLPNTQFKSEPIYLEMVRAEETQVQTVPNDVMVVRYYPTMAQAYYRTNQRGALIEREYTERLVPPHVRETGKVLRPGKIWSHPAAAQCVQMLEDLGIHSIGRYARWQQKWLSHETWAQIQAMELPGS